MHCIYIVSDWRLQAEFMYFFFLPQKYKSSLKVDHIPLLSLQYTQQSKIHNSYVYCSHMEERKQDERAHSWFLWVFSQIVNVSCGVLADDELVHFF